METRRRDLWTEEKEEQEREPMERQNGQKERVYAGLENDEGQRAYRIQMRQSRVMTEQRSNSKMEIHIWLVIGDKYSKSSSEHSVC